MAVAATLLTSGSDTTNTAATYATASVTPTANALVIAGVVSGIGTSPPPSVSSISGNGLTWVEIGTAGGVTFQQASPLKRLQLFRAMGASPTAGAITFTMSASTSNGELWAITEFSGMDTSGTNGSGAIVQSNTNSGSSVTSLSVTLTSPVSTNGTYACFSHNVAEAQTATAPMANLTDVSMATPAQEMSAQFVNSGQSSPTCSWTTAAGPGGFAVEILAASAASASIEQLIAADIFSAGE